MPQCGKIGAFQYNSYENIITFMVVESSLNILFFVMMFMIRNVKDEFKMGNELRTMTLTRFVVDLLFLFPIVFYPTSAFTMLGCAQYF